MSATEADRIAACALAAALMWGDILQCAAGAIGADEAGVASLVWDAVCDLDFDLGDSSPAGVARVLLADAAKIRAAVERRMKGEE